MKRRIFAVVGLLTILYLAGCGNNVENKMIPDSTPQNGGIYRRAFSDSYIMLDPAKLKDSNSHEVCRQLYDGLVEFDENANVVPALAKDWTISDSKLVYTFNLRDDVSFHSEVSGTKTTNGGRRFVAEDVQYSFLRLLCPDKESQVSYFFVIKGARDYSAGKNTDIAGIRVIGSHTVEFELEKPFAPFISLLAMCNSAVVPKEDAEEQSLLERPVGTGPFIFSRRASDSIVLEANSQYFRGRPFLDKIEFVVIEDELQRFEDFGQGLLSQVDVPDSQYKNVKKNSELAPFLVESSLWSTNYLAFNIHLPPFDNKDVRKAFNYAVDRSAIVKLVLNDRAQVAHGVLPPGIPGYNFVLEGYSHNLPKAREFLAKAGYPDGKGFPEITLQYNRDVIHSRTAEFVMANLRDVGIKCLAREVEFGEHLKTVEEGRAPFFRLGWTVDYPDPDSFLYALFHSSNIGAGYNFSGLKLEQLDSVLDQARFETELGLREKLYQKAEELIVEEAPWVFLYFYSSYILHQPYVKGLKLGPMGESLVQYRKIWLDKRPVLKQ